MGKDEMGQDSGAPIASVTGSGQRMGVAEHLAAFSEKEVFEAISQMKNNKAPGPDGFPAEF